MVQRGTTWSGLNELVFAKRTLAHREPENQSMPRKLKLVKGRQPRSALVYGMRIFAIEDVASIEDANVNLNDGTSGRITMHLIEGTRTQIRRQLLQSIDAFFELLDQQSSPH
jgi:hypothetical protein